MTNPMPTRSLGSVSAPMSEQSASSAPVRVTSRVVSELDDLTPDAAASVARAIERIGKEEGEPFSPPDAREDERYLVMVPDRDEAPIVVYRKDKNGYLVTGLAKRADFKTYTAEPSESFLDTPIGQAALAAGGTLLITWLLNRARSRGSTGSAGTVA
jgi:hypothetical protein